MKRKDPLRNRYTVPITDDMKSRLEDIKRTYKVDLAEMAREFLKGIIEQADRGDIQPGNKEA